MCPHTSLNLLPPAPRLQQAVVAGWVLYYLDTQMLPSIMRDHKLHACWAAATKRYHVGV